MPPRRRRVALVFSLSLAFAGAAPAQGTGGHDYPTVDRVEFVLECMHRNAGKQEFLYKCACVIDEIARHFSYDAFVEAATAARYQSLAGDRGGLFRDPAQTRDTAKRYLQVQGAAMKRCDVPR
ncbi:MAG: hypothetical protein ACREQZ_03240 [Woeseiaceae bacterium]